jgi:hypothetical protein
MICSGGHLSFFQFPICKVPHLFLLALSSYTETPVYEGKKEKDGQIVPSTQNLNQLLGSTL